MKDNSTLIWTSEIQRYTNDLSKIPVLSHEEQMLLLYEIRNPRVTKKEVEIAKNKLIIGNLRFVITLAKKFQHKDIDFLDLVSEGNIGLIKAIDKYDINSNMKFTTYAVWWVRQGIMAYLNDMTRLIRLPTNIVQSNLKNAKLDNVSEINNFNYFSLDYREDDKELIEIIPNKNVNEFDNLFNDNEFLRKNLNILISKLDNREKEIIELYYGLNGIEYTLEDLAEKFNCSLMRINQLLDKALKKIRNESFSIYGYL